MLNPKHSDFKTFIKINELKINTKSSKVSDLTVCLHYLNLSADFTNFSSLITPFPAKTKNNIATEVNPAPIL
jgi:hypothetical protein